MVLLHVNRMLIALKKKTIVLKNTHTPSIKY